MLFPVIQKTRTLKITFLLFSMLLASEQAGLLAYQQPRTANVDFDPAGIVIDLPMADRLPVLLIGLATDYPNVTDRQRAAALAITMKLHPDSMAAQAANRDLATGNRPSGMGLGIPLPDAAGELREIAMEIQSEALTEDQRKLGLYLTAVALMFSDGKNPRPAKGPLPTDKESDKLWRDVLSRP